MSWQAYVDQSLVGTGHVNKAAIISVAGDSIWASSAGFTPSTAEMKNIADIYADKAGARDKAFSEGLHIGNDRYVATRIEDRSIYARKGREGIAIVKTNQAILLGHHGEQTQAGNASATVEKLADYLIGLGY